MDSQRLDVRERFFGSRQFERLWYAQVVSALGDWLGFFAVAIVATQIGTSPDAAVGLVMAARLVPGFFLAPVAGLLVDRWPRKQVMVTCDLGRAAIVATLPFVRSLGQLVLASLLLEMFTLLWAPAKEASVPRLVPADKLTSANSLSLAAAYGTFPIASLMFALLAPLSATLAGIGAIEFLNFDREGALAFYVDVATFLVAAALISRLDLPARSRLERRRAADRRIDWAQAFHELKEGWHFIFLNPTVRAVNLGLALALVGGGMLVPLGPVFSVEVLDAGDAGFGAMLTALGFGGAVGVVAVNAVQRHLPRTGTFTGVLFGASVALFMAASFDTVGWVSFWVFLVGMFAGSSYVLGFTMLHEHVDDTLMGRTFGALFTLVRFCLLLAFVLGPFLSAFFGRLSARWLGGEVAGPGLALAMPGVRLTLWFAAAVILVAAVVAAHSMRVGARQASAHPSRRLVAEAA